MKAVTEEESNMHHFVNFRNSIIIIFISWIILAIVFGFYDLQISIVVVSWNELPGSLGIFIKNFGEFGAEYGEGPGWGLISVSIVILIGSFIKNRKLQNLPAWIIVGISLTLFIIGSIIPSYDLMWYGGFIGFSIILLELITLKSDLRNFRNIALIILLLAILNPLLFVNITKPLCGRVRFRDLSDFSQYTPWFLPPGLDLNNLSFPSGHTAMGWILLPLMILFRNRRTWIRSIGIFLIFGWGFFVGLSRIIVGAHYASDVLFSTEMAFLITLLLFKKFSYNMLPDMKE
ncbi:MAG: phosphatase PAP2 family protein [Candidatus Lokiarchaeota archaeon]|nr:phosphatase PAP2 family protein [Candidatus Lokiarchaeota archaeon]